MVFQLMYYSAAREEYNDRQLRDILKVSRANNRECGVTGLLLYGEGAFFQVLEGEEADVRARYASIEKDPRHQWIVIAAQREVKTRSFGDWSMGFSPLDPELKEDVEAMIRLKRAGNEMKQADCDPFINVLVESFMVNQRLA